MEKLKETTKSRPSTSLSLTASDKCKAVLSVWTEKRKPSQVCKELGVKWTILMLWQNRAMEGMLQALEPRRNLEKGASVESTSSGNAGAAGKKPARTVCFEAGKSSGNAAGEHSGEGGTEIFGEHENPAEGVNDVGRPGAEAGTDYHAGSRGNDDCGGRSEPAGVSRKTYYEWEKKGLSALMDALEDKDVGRPQTSQEDPEKEA